MHAKRINNWLSDSQLKSCLKKQDILEWLNEEGSITAKISSDSKFKLEILSDDLGMAEDEEYLALNIPSQKVRIREVILYGDLAPLVFARSIIPNQTSSKGYPRIRGLLDQSHLAIYYFKASYLSKHIVSLRNFKLLIKKLFGEEEHIISFEDTP